MKTIRTYSLDSRSIKKSMKINGINVSHCYKTGKATQIVVVESDIEKAKKFFNEFEIVAFNGKAPWIVSGCDGEFQFCGLFMSERMHLELNPAPPVRSTISIECEIVSKQTLLNLLKLNIEVSPTMFNKEIDNVIDELKIAFETTLARSMFHSCAAREIAGLDRDFYNTIFVPIVYK